MRLQAYAGWIAAAVLGTCAAVDGWRWFETARVNRAIVDGSIVGQEHAIAPQAVFARAYFLAQLGDNEPALNLYKRLQDDKGDFGALARAARFNAGNIHFREATMLQKTRGDATFGAIIATAELAKQAYRDVLRGDPRDWDALQPRARAAPAPIPTEHRRNAATKRTRGDHDAQRHAGPAMTGFRRRNRRVRLPIAAACCC
jgi:mxaK protein